jgi:hypothetical protein
MALIRIYGREFTFKASAAPGAFTLSAAVHSFEPFSDVERETITPPGGESFVVLGRHLRSMSKCRASWWGREPMALSVC